MADVSNRRRRQTLEKAMCKYGTDCYQKNPDHHRRFRHPSPIPSNETDEHSSKNASQPSEISPKKKIVQNGKGTLVAEAVETESVQKLSTNRKTPKKLSPSPTDPALNIKEMFLVEMPPDFFSLWEFCSSLDAVDPSEVFSEVGLHLVGPYDVLSKKISNEDICSDNILRHWRYYYDPPEFLTVIKRDGEDCYHIGYFRDDPSELPFAVASNSVADGPKFKLMGDNIFCAMNMELKDAIKNISSKESKKKFKAIQERLQEYAKEKNFSLEKQTPKIKARKKAVVAQTFHGFGIVVPYDKERDVGYRSIPETNAGLKNILSKIAKSKTEEERLDARSSLDEILTDLQFANDECDYGMGLELGLDLFCFGEPCLHKDVLSVLPLAYDLLERPQFARIITSHLSDRKKGDNLSIKAV